MPDLATEAEQFVNPTKLYARHEVLSSQSPVPAAPGVYGWWFSTLPTTMDVSHCATHAGHTLLYTGISPRRPPGNGAKPSSQDLRSRIRTHFTGNAEGSTLRKTLGSLLAPSIGIELRRVGSGKRMTFTEGERILSEWMSIHARVSWVVRDMPWELEDHLIASLDVPLNLDGNSRNVFHPKLKAARAAAVDRARRLPVLPNPGIGGR